MPELSNYRLTQRMTIIMQYHLRIFRSSGGEVDQHRVGGKNSATHTADQFCCNRFRIQQFILISDPRRLQTLSGNIVDNHPKLEIRTVRRNLIHLFHILAVDNNHFKAADLHAVGDVFYRHHMR